MFLVRCLLACAIFCQALQLGSAFRVTITACAKCRGARRLATTRSLSFVKMDSLACTNLNTSRSMSPDGSEGEESSVSSEVEESSASSEGEEGGVFSEPTTSEDSVVKSALIGLINVYKQEISPLLPPACRFFPTCSVYAVSSIEKYGASKGFILMIWRLMRCTPLGGYGYDPPQWPPPGWFAGKHG